MSCTKLETGNPIKRHRAAGFFAKGVIYHTMGDYKNTLKFYNKAIRQDAQPVYLNGRGVVHLVHDKLRLAEKDFSRAIALAPRCPDGYVHRGSARRGLKKFTEAITDFNRGIRLNPNQATFYGERALTYKALSEFDKSLRDYDRAIELDPNDSTYFNERGITLGEKREYRRAISNFDRAIELNPEYSVAFYNRGLTYCNGGQRALALVDFNKAIELNPQYTDAYITRGNEFAQADELNLAIRDFETALELNQGYAHLAYMGKGNVYLLGGKLEMAKEAFNQMIELHPDFALARFGLGSVNVAEGAFDKALENYDKCVHLSRGKYSIAFLCRGLLHHARSDRFNAVQDFDGAVRLSSDFEALHFQSQSVALFNAIPFLFDIDQPWVEVVKGELRKHIVRLDNQTDPAYFYYRGVHLLYDNNRFTAYKYFRKAQGLGFEDSEKIGLHLSNLAPRIPVNRWNESGAQSPAGSR